MNKLLLALIIITGTASLHGMELEKKLDLVVDRPDCMPLTSSELKSSPITFAQTYYYLAHEVLLPEITQQIFCLQLKVCGIDLAQLSLEIKQSCKDPDIFVKLITALIESCGYNLATELCKQFFTYAKISICDIKDKKNGKKTALHYAASKDNIEIVKLLLDLAGDNVGTLLTMKGYSRTALHFAAADGHANIVKLLLDTARDRVWILLTMKDGDNWTALHWAAWKGSRETVKLLLDAAGDKAQVLMDIRGLLRRETAFDRAKPKVQEVMKPYLKNSSCLTFCPNCCLF